MKSLSMVAMLCVLLQVSPTPVYAIDGWSVRVCFGEDQANGCPVSHDAMYGCGVSIDDVAPQICSVRVNGKRKELPYSVVKQGAHSGGHCGYDWYQLTCHGD